VHDASDLRALLSSIDGRGYGAWKQLAGTWALDALDLEVEKVQTDPFAPPTRLAVRCPAAQLALPEELVATVVRRRALADHLLRVVGHHLEAPLAIDVGGQQVIERSAARLDADGALTLRCTIVLPDRRRRVRSAAVEQALLEQLPEAVAALRWSVLDQAAARAFVECVEDAATLREQLAERGLVAFVGDGAVLARRTGIDDRPAVPEAVVPFASPPELRIEVDLPNRGRVTGMGLDTGVSLIVGGGFHGKSTLLSALRAGVYDHVPGDGRELVVTRGDAVTIRAEDGRRVERVDISAFIDGVPDPVRGVADTSRFSSDNASGSTSQAAAIVEALEVGTGLLLIDEDTAATNLMARDLRMQELVTPAGGTSPSVYAAEPITPLVDLVRSLADDHGVSTVLVAGSGGDYLEVADRVVQMDAFEARDVTAQAREVTARVPGRPAVPTRFPAVPQRIVDPATVDARRRGRVKTRVFGLDRILFGNEEIELGALEQLVDRAQAAGVAAALVRLVEDGHLDGRATVREAIDGLFAEVDATGVGVLRAGWPGDLARPRPAEVAAALNRLRSLAVSDVRR
jgi:predicted ABC-class ATPase